MYKVATVLVVALGTAIGTQVFALEPRQDIERAVDLIEAKQYSLARTYLTPALMAPRISNGERSRAYYLRGYSYLVDGMPVSARKDFARALEFSPTNPAALVEMGRLYLSGRGLQQDPTLAFQLFQEAAQTEYPPAQFHVGYAYLLGQGVEKNLPEAREWLGAAAESGHVFAMMSLAASYRREHVAQSDPQAAASWYRRAGEAGEPKALVSLGFMYQNGEFGEVDHARAVTLYQQAAQHDLGAAQVNLAYAYLTGRGIQADPARALDLYKRAAAKSEPASFVGLGHIYEHGLGVAADPAEAKRWFERGAQIGNLDAQLRLVGLLLRQDTEVARREAVRWSGEAAKSGTPRAQNDYAWLLATSKFAEVRNGTLAVAQATQAVEQQPSAAFLDTLAAAYAEMGDFQQAVETQLKALSAASGDEALSRDLERRLRLYQRSEPWRE